MGADRTVFERLNSLIGFLAATDRISRKVKYIADADGLAKSPSTGAELGIDLDPGAFGGFARLAGVL